MIDTFCWVVAIVVFLIVEASTAALVSIWFAIGSLAALIASVLGVDVLGQILTFVVFSAASIIVLRKFAVKKNNTDKINLDRIIGQNILIFQTVDNSKSEGLARINGIEWRVKSEDGEIIEEGELATVVKIDGVKLIVRKNNI
ncbi:MAG: NfeD family protein [Clostridia bacterium]|nr:NfeD family protein [Clostridia bacterium]